MGVKYVKDFSFPASGGFHVQRYAKGGHVTKVPAKAKASAKDMPARAKPNAPARGAPKMESKPARGRRQGFAEGGFNPIAELTPEERLLQQQAYDAANPEQAKINAQIQKDLEAARAARPDLGLKSKGAPLPPPEDYYDAPPRLPEARYARDTESRLDRGMRPGQMARRQRVEDRINAEREAAMRPRKMRDLPSYRLEPPRGVFEERESIMPVPEPQPRPQFGLESQEETNARLAKPQPYMGVNPMNVPVFKNGGKVAKVMREYKKGELHSGSKKGPVVKDRKQAVAIALSEARKAGAKIPKKAEGGIFNDENLAYKSKGPKTRYTPIKGRRMARERAMERRALDKARHAEKYAPGLSLDMPDKKANGGEIKKAVHKHERSKHPGESLTKLRKGGVPSYGRKPMYGGGKC